MPSNIAESSTYETVVIGPDDGDAMSAASVRNGMQDLANRTRFLRDAAIGRHHVDLARAFLDQPDITWTQSFDGILTVISQTADVENFALPFPDIAGDGLAIKRVDARIKGGGPHSQLPTTPPTVVVSQVDDDLAYTDIVTAVDAATTVAGYEAAHDITSGPISVNLDPSTYRYVMRFTRETGTGALNGLTIYSVFVEIGLQ